MTIRAKDRTLMQECIDRGLRRMWARTHKYMSDDVAGLLTDDQWQALETATIEHGEKSIWLNLDETFDITDDDESDLEG